MIIAFDATKMGFLTVMRLQLKKINAILEMNDEDIFIEELNHSKASCLYETILQLSTLIEEANTRLKSIGQERVLIKSISTDFPEAFIPAPSDSFWAIDSRRKYFNDEKRPRAFYEVICAYLVSPTHEVAKNEDEIKKEIWKKITELKVANEDNILYWDNYQCEWKRIHKDTNPWTLSECQCFHNINCKRTLRLITRIYS